MNNLTLPEVPQYNITTYHWNGKNWSVYRVRKSSTKINYDSATKEELKTVRWRPCLWNNGVDEILATECPEGYVKGKLLRGRKPTTSWGCPRCGRSFDRPNDLKIHECINPR
jgi:hypothetical protein